MQTTIVILILAVAGIFLFRRFIRIFNKTKAPACGCGCDGCTSGQSDSGDGCRTPFPDGQ